MRLSHLVLVAVLALLCACRAAPSSRIAWISLGPDPALQECQQAIVDALAQAGWREGVNLSIDRHELTDPTNQARPLWEALDQLGYDALVGFTTPVARAAAKAPLETPVLITYCFDLRAAGIDASTPWISGVEMPPPLEAVAQRLMEWRVQRVGVVYNPDEANSVRHVERVRALLDTKAITLVAVAAHTESEALSAAHRLLVLKVDAAWKLGDNTLKNASEAMIRTWASAGLPVLGDHARQLAWGARETISIDFEEVGRRTGVQLAKMLAGARLSAIPAESIRAQEAGRDR